MKKTVKAPTSRKIEDTAQVIEATLLELVNCGSSDTARVSAAKALMDLVKFMNGEKDQSATEREEAEKTAAIAQARTLLAEFAELKLKLGSNASAAADGLEQPHAVVDKCASKPDNAIV